MRGAVDRAGPARRVDRLHQPPDVGNDDLKMVLNNTFTAGGAIRMQSPSTNLIGKSNLDRNVCGVPYNSCQGVFRDQIFPAQRLLSGRWCRNALRRLNRQ